MQYSFRHIDPSGRRVLRGVIATCWAKGRCVNLLWKKWGYVNADSYRQPPNPFRVTYVRFWALAIWIVLA